MNTTLFSEESSIAATLLPLQLGNKDFDSVTPVVPIQVRLSMEALTVLSVKFFPRCNADSKLCPVFVDFLFQRRQLR